MSKLNRFRHAQTDSETLKKIDFDPDPTGFCLGSDTILTRMRQDLTPIRRGFDSDPPQGQVGAGPGEPLNRF